MNVTMSYKRTAAVPGEISCALYLVHALEYLLLSLLGAAGMEKQHDFSTSLSTLMVGSGRDQLGARRSCASAH